MKHFRRMVIAKMWFTSCLLRGPESNRRAPGHRGFTRRRDSIRASAWRTLTGAQDQLHLPNDRKLTVETIVGQSRAPSVILSRRWWRGCPDRKDFLLPGMFRQRLPSRLRVFVVHHVSPEEAYTSSCQDSLACRQIPIVPCLCNSARGPHRYQERSEASTSPPLGIRSSSFSHR